MKNKLLKVDQFKNVQGFKCLECENKDNILFKISEITATKGTIDKVYFNCKFCLKTKYPKYFETKKEYRKLDQFEMVF